MFPLAPETGFPFEYHCMPYVPGVGVVAIATVKTPERPWTTVVDCGCVLKAAELQAGLEKTAGFLRGQLAKRMLLRTVPQLHFIYDASIDRGMKLSKMIDEALASSNNPEDKASKT